MKHCIYFQTTRFAHSLDARHHPARISWLTESSLHDFVFISPVYFVLRLSSQPACPEWEREAETNLR